jgi:hypothetical protein
MQDCSLPREEIVAYQEGSLNPAREAELAVHIGQCSDCQRQLHVSADVTQIFERVRPLWNDAVGRQWEVRRIHGTDSSTLAGRFLIAAMFIAVLMPIMSIVLLWPSPTDAGTGFAGLVNFGRQYVGQSGSGHEPLSEPVQMKIPDPELHIIPETLPHDLTLVGHEPRPDGGVRLFYANRDGELELRVNQGPKDLWEDVLMTDDPRFARTGDTGVAWTAGQREGTVSALVWERQEIVFAILVVRAPAGARGGMELDDGLKLVNAFIDEQDRFVRE